MKRLLLNKKQANKQTNKSLAFLNVDVGHRHMGCFTCMDINLKVVMERKWIERSDKKPNNKAHAKIKKAYRAERSKQKPETLR